jgi:hypothetical protein
MGIYDRSQQCQCGLDIAAYEFTAVGHDVFLKVENSYFSQQINKAYHKRLDHVLKTFNPGDPRVFL